MPVDTDSGVWRAADEAVVTETLRRAIQVGTLRAVLEGHLSALVYAGEIEVRDVPADRLDGTGEGTIPCYTLGRDLFKSYHRRFSGLFGLASPQIRRS